jgi:hypothetical protein
LGTSGLEREYNFHGSQEGKVELGNETKIAEKLISQVGRELSFRKHLVQYVASVLRSDAPSSVKIFTLTILALFGLVSFQFCVLLIHAGCAFLHLVQISFAPYLYIFGAQSGGILAAGIPLVIRMSSLEEAKRFEAELRVVTRQKRLGRRGKAVGETTS